MKDYGLVSIITPSYNCSRYIGDTIKSIQNQSYKNWELLITDDCSSDNTFDLILQYAKGDDRIKCFSLTENSGAGVARNNSIKQAKGKYIAFCDSDDRWLPTKLEKQLNLMEEKKCAAVYSSYFVCNDNGAIKGLILCRKNESAFSIKCDDKMGNLTFMYNEQVTGKLYMPDIRKRQDWAHKMAVMNICKTAYGVQEPLAIYRHAETSISKKKYSLVKYNILGLMTLGWSKTKSTVFFAFCFMPCYIMKCISRAINNSKYKEFMHLIPEDMLH